MLIQFHFLQNYAPSNLNRDDTGSPKDAIFGGVLRGRISSQCLKRSFRRSAVFAEAFKADGLLGERTKMLPLIIREELTALGAEPKAIEAIVARVPEIGRESIKRAKEEVADEGDGEEEANEASESEEPAEAKTEETKQLIFIDRAREARPLAELLLGLYRKVGAAKWTSMKPGDITKAVGSRAPGSVDIALFGRMTTSAAFVNVQAAAQVAHALSTNALTQEFDYYTAMDDLQPENEPGADMIGDVEFNSCTYYKYVNVHWEELVKNLRGDAAVAKRAVLALLEAAALTHPTGKQNGFAAFNPPDFILVEVSERNLPVSYANAFVKPVRASGAQSLLAQSTETLGAYVGRMSKAYGLTAHRAYLSVDGLPFAEAEAQSSLGALKAWLGAQIMEG